MTVLVGLIGGVATYRQIFIGTGILLVVSNFLYALAGVANSKWLILFSRIGLGLGAGTLGTVRAYFAETYDEQNRTSALAVTAAVQYAGFALFPGVGELVDLVCAKAGWHVPLFNEYTLPAWFMMILCALSVLMLLWSFSEPEHKKFELRDLIPIYKPWVYQRAGIIGRSIKKAFGLQTEAEADREARQFDPNAPSNLELTTFKPNLTLSASSSSITSNPLYRSSLDSIAKELKRTSGSISGKECADGSSSDEDDGLDGIGEDSDKERDVGLEEDQEELNFGDDSNNSDTDPSPSPISDKKNARIVTMIWISFLVLNFLIRVALGTVEVLGSDLYDGVTAKYIKPPAEEFSPASGTFYMILGIIGTVVTLVFAIFAKKIVDEIPFFLSLVSLFLGSTTLIGDLATMGLGRFSFAMALIYSVGYPLAQSVVVSMFSKIPASQRNQAVSMSWIGSAGSIGRILGPIAVGAIFHKGGAPPTFFFNTCITTLILGQAAVTVFYIQKISL